MTVERVTDAYGLSEGPHWDHRTQKLYFVDIYNQYIRRLDPATGVVTSAYIGKLLPYMHYVSLNLCAFTRRFRNVLSANGTVGVVIPVDDSIDQLIAGVGKNLAVITWNGESDESEVPVEILCSLDSEEAQTRINDGKVDSSGRFWLGELKTL